MTSSDFIIDNIKKLRELKNYTQQYMAESLGITQAAYSKIEKGKTQLSYIKLEKIANILEVTVEAVVNFDPQLYFKKFNSKKVIYNESAVSTANQMIIEKKLYQDKIVLLELLLTKTDSELDRYKKIYGTLQY